MARIFAGDTRRIDREVLLAAESLPDDFWVLAEFNLRRNYDWVVIRPFHDAPATLIVAEVKRVAHPLRGAINSPWEERLDNGTWAPVSASHRSDTNYYWQVVNSANALSEWLRNNEPVFNEGKTGVWTNSKVWPDLILLSATPTAHYLPIKPDSGYGSWFFDLNRWVEHVAEWTPTVGPILDHVHVQRLVTYLGLSPISAHGAQQAGKRVGTVGAVDQLDRLERAMAELSQRVGDYNARLARVEEQLQAMRPGHRSSARRDDAGVASGGSGDVDRPLTPNERSALLGAVRAVKLKGKSRAVPSVLGELSHLLGEHPKQSSYWGFGTAMAFLERAEKDHVIKLGPRSGPSPTIWLADEPIVGMESEIPQGTDRPMNA